MCVGGVIGLATRVGGLGWYAMRVARLLRSTEGVYRRIESHRVAGWHKVAGSRSGGVAMHRAGKQAGRRQRGTNGAARYRVLRRHPGAASRTRIAQAKVA